MTELVASFVLRPDAPNDVKRLVADLLDPDRGGIDGQNLWSKHDHPFFKAPGWCRAFMRSGAVMPLGRKAHFRKDGHIFFEVWCSVDPNGNFIENFFDWLAPYIQPWHERFERTFIGYQRAENENDPALIYLENGRIIHVHIRPDGIGVKE